MMDAAFVIPIKTRHDRTERQSPDQHAANSEASWFFCSVMVFGLSNHRVKMGGLDSSSQPSSKGVFGVIVRTKTNGILPTVPDGGH